MRQSEGTPKDMLDSVERIIMKAGSGENEKTGDTLIIFANENGSPYEKVSITGKMGDLLEGIASVLHALQGDNISDDEMFADLKRAMMIVKVKREGMPSDIGGLMGILSSLTEVLKDKDGKTPKLPSFGDFLKSQGLTYDSENSDAPKAVAQGLESAIENDRKSGFNPTMLQWEEIADDDSCDDSGDAGNDKA